MLKELQKNNKDLSIYSLDDPRFSKYGRVLEGDFREACQFLEKNVTIPQKGNAYTPADQAFKTHLGNAFSELFGGIPLQYGYVAGQNSVMNAVEYHKSPEVNLAASPMVLFLGDVRDIQNGRYHTDRLEAFYIPAYTAIELFSTTLHFSPCKVSPKGFICAVILPKGTNQDLEISSSKDPLLFKHNKWLLAHPSHERFVSQGAAVRLEGKPPLIHVP
ncbi:MAG: DUF4867 family protein [Bacillota bacterium]